MRSRFEWAAVGRGRWIAGFSAALLLGGCGGSDDPSVGPSARDASARDASVRDVASAAADLAPVEAAAADELAPSADAPRRPVPLAEPGRGIDPGAPLAPTAPVLTPTQQTRRDESAAAAIVDGPRRALELLIATENEFGEHAVLRLDEAWQLLALSDALSEGSGDGAEGTDAAEELRLQAHAALDEADALAADLPGAVVLRSRLLRGQGGPGGPDDQDRDAAACALLRAHLERFPGDAAAHMELGNIAHDAKEWATADTHLSLAAQLDPTNGRARLRATVAKQWLTAQGDAAYTKYVLRRGYRDAARLLPDDDVPLRMMVGLYPSGSPRRMQVLEDVIADNPGAVEARLRLARLCVAADKPDPGRAIALLDEVARLAPENGRVRLDTARVLVAAGRFSAAVSGYIDALSLLDGADRVRASNALDALLHPGDPERGIALELRERACDALVAANPDDGRFGNNAGFWFREQAQDYDTSLRFYRAAVAASPQDQDYACDTGYLYLHHLRDRRERCEALFLAARRLVEEDDATPTRGYWDSLEHLCRYYFEIGRYRDVVVCADLRVGPDVTPNGPPSQSAVAESYRKKAEAKLGGAR